MTFWTKETKAKFRHHPVKCTVMVAGFVLWYGLFACTTLLIGGVLVLAGKNDAWVDWWMP